MCTIVASDNWTILILQYYLEENLEARQGELEREEELEETFPKVKAKLKMPKVMLPSHHAPKKEVANLFTLRIS